MRWRMWIGLFWFLLVPSALLFNIVAQRFAARRDRQVERVLRRIDRVLVVWAESWGEPPDIVRKKLLNAVHEE